MIASGKQNNPRKIRHILLFAGLIYLFIYTLSPVFCMAEIKVLAVSPDIEKIELGPYIQILEDTSKTLSIIDVSSPQFSDKFLNNQSTSVNRGITESPYWFRFSLIWANKNQHTTKSVTSLTVSKVTISAPVPYE